MRPPLVPYNPVITLTWTFSFFVLFSPSTPVILRRLLTSFSFLFLNSGETSRLLIYTQGSTETRGRRWSASAESRHQHGGGGSFPRIYSQLLRHYFSREAPGIFAANSSSTATILLLLQTATAQHLFGIHPSIHLVLVGRKREAGQPFSMDIFLFVRSFFFECGARDIISFHSLTLSFRRMRWRDICRLASLYAGRRPAHST